MKPSAATQKAISHLAEASRLFTMAGEAGLKGKTTALIAHVLREVGSEETVDAVIEAARIAAGVSADQRTEIERAKATLKRKGWSYRSAAPVLGVHFLHIAYTLTGRRYSAKLLQAIEDMPSRAALSPR